MSNLLIVNSEDVKIADFIGCMGNKSIASICANDLGFDEDIVGYISIADEEGVHYAEFLDSEGTGEIASSKNIDDLQKWLTDEIYKMAKTYSYAE